MAAIMAGCNVSAFYSSNFITALPFFIFCHLLKYKLNCPPLENHQQLSAFIPAVYEVSHASERVSGITLADLCYTFAMTAKCFPVYSDQMLHSYPGCGDCKVFFFYSLTSGSQIILVHISIGIQVPYKSDGVIVGNLKKEPLRGTNSKAIT